MMERSRPERAVGLGRLGAGLGAALLFCCGPEGEPTATVRVEADGSRLVVDVDCRGRCDGAPYGDDLANELPSLESAALPRWNGAEVNRPEPMAADTATVEIHLDISHPMAGFLPLSGSDASPFRVTAQNTAQHLARLYGGAGSFAVRWRGIGHELTRLAGTPNLTRDLFDGRSTRLELSVGSILAGLESGELRAGAIITDLMATGGDTGVTGPVNVANALDAWLASRAVRSGEHHAGILGVRAEYRGVFHPSACPRGPPLGCWYDESLPGFRRLGAVTSVPFYVLALGPDGESVASLLSSLLRGIRELDPDLEAQWELLTHRSLGVLTRLDCTAGEQYSLYHARDPDYYTLIDREAIALSCDLEGLVAASADATWTGLPPVDGASEGGDRTVHLAITGTATTRSPIWRVHPWAQRVVGGKVRDDAPDWSDWTSELTTLGKTTQLDGLLDRARIRPDSYEIDLPLLRFLGS